MAQGRSAKIIPMIKWIQTSRLSIKNSLSDAQVTACAATAGLVMRKVPSSQLYLTRCVYQFVLESQFPHRTVNFTFLLVIVNNKLTILWGS